MYDIINDVISHTWVSNYSGEQAYVYSICGVLCVLFIAHFADFVRWIMDMFRIHK